VEGKGEVNLTGCLRGAIAPLLRKKFPLSKSGEGDKGGEVRAEKLTPERRSEIAKKAAQARWKTKT